MGAAGFPEGFFDRQDESEDALFYAQPRFVVHIDDATIAALTGAYRELLPDVVDAMVRSGVAEEDDGAALSGKRCRTQRKR